ncbi:MAG: HNH endonuclease signature motif containing protein [Candidatus Latescibacter sp.]|nr:HNH endonuclease signature motif containing protein [Candidatus Latescibacter sp.]
MGRRSRIDTRKPESMKKEEFLCRLLAHGYLSLDENGRLHRHWDRQYGRDIYTDILIDKIAESGYMIAFLKLGDAQTMVRVHRLIWWYFFGEIPENMQINHIDGDRANNRLNNLEMVTPSQNLRHAVNVIKTIKKNWESQKSIYTKEDYQKLKAMIQSGMRSKDIREKMNMKFSTFYSIRRRIRKGIEGL